MSVAAVAEELGTSPQNLNAKFNRKSIKIDFFQKIKEIIDKCAPPRRDGRGCFRFKCQWFEQFKCLPVAW